jgi:hypothetical protein
MLIGCFVTVSKDRIPVSPFEFVLFIVDRLVWLQDQSIPNSCEHACVRHCDNPASGPVRGNQLEPGGVAV